VNEIGLRHRLKRALRQIEAQHRHLRPIYAELVRSLDSGGVEDMRRWIARYREALEAHFAVEEEVLFPALRGLRPASEPQLVELSDEHVSFAAELRGFEQQLERGYGHASAAGITALAAQLEAHERREEQLLGDLVDAR
jgi:hemerythrin-like domain-containing protein